MAQELYHCPTCFRLSEPGHSHCLECDEPPDSFMAEAALTEAAVRRELAMAVALRRAQSKAPPKVGTWTLLATLVVSILIPSLFQ